MKRLFSLVIAVYGLMTQLIQAQTIIQTPHQADSLRRAIMTAREDIRRINAINALSTYFWSIPSLYDSSLVYAQIAQTAAKRIGFRIGIVEAWNNIANVYRNQGKYDEALECSIKALQMSEEFGDSKNIANSLNIIAIVYRNQGKYNEALTNHFKSLTINEKLGDKRNIANTLYTIGIVYRNQGKFAEALEYSFKALRMCEELGDKRGIASALHNIAVVYRQQNKFTESLDYSFKALNVSEEIGNKDFRASALHSIANVYRDQKKNSEALAYTFKALQAKEELRDKEGIAGLLYNIALIHMRSHRYDSALVYGYHSAALADSIGVRQRKQLALRVISQTYDSLGKYSLALAIYRQYVALKDSIVNLDNLNATAALKEEYEAEKRQQQIALLNNEKALQQSELERQKLDLERSQVEVRAHEQSLLLLQKEKQLQQITLSRQQMELSAANAREVQDKQALALAASEQELQRTELQRRNVVQWSLGGFLVMLLVVSVWLGWLYRQKIRANAKVLLQQHVMEDQAHEINKANSELQELNAILLNQNQKLEGFINEKNELMGIVAHDLKNPISSIRGFAKLVESGIAPLEDAPQMSAQIICIANRMLELVANLLEINRLESGDIQFRYEIFDIVPLVESTMVEYSPQAAAKNILLHLDFQPASNLVIADQQAMIQVLDNIISNAVKYSPNDKQVFVRVLRHSSVVSGRSSNDTAQRITNEQLTNDFLRIEVQDEGPGISEEDMKKLFGKFARLSAQPTGGEHSTGLGLSIVKKMVEAMNGRVWCESELGKGATFIVELPSIQ